jgi:hypothetical protein
VEALEEARALVDRDPRAAVPDAHHGPVAAEVERDLDPAARGAELDRVAEKVVEHLGEPVAVAADARDFVELRAHGDALVLGLGPGGLQAAPGGGPQIGVLWRSCSRPGLGLGKEHDAGHQPQQPLGVAVDHGDEAPPLLAQLLLSSSTSRRRLKKSFVC